jgi:DNA polymerase elongation subunit (family B)
MIPELRDILFLDIETVACTGNYHLLDERIRIQWERKASWIKRDEGVSDEQLFHQKAAIYAEFGKVVCIGVGILRENEKGEPVLRLKAYAGHDEKELLTNFCLMLEKLNTTTTKLCAHNGREFDFPYLSRRMLVNGIPLPALLDLSGKKPWEVSHLDTLEMWKFGDYKHYTSLDLLAALFNIPSSKNGMDGSMVNTVYYQEQNLEKIKKYCLSDVVVLAQLYLRLRSLPCIPEQNIEEVLTTS